MRKLILFFAALTTLFSCEKKDKKKHFVDKENTAVFTIKFVIYQNKEVTNVYHSKEDGTWQFFSNDEFQSYEDVAIVVPLKQIVKRDSTLLDITNLPVGFSASRNSKGQNWKIQKYEEK